MLFHKYYDRRNECRYYMCPLMDEWRRKTVHQYKGMLFSLKRKAILTRAAAGMNLEGIMLSDVS